MPTDDEADLVHLRVPTQPSMAAVVTVAVRVLGGRAGLPEAEIEAARSAVAQAYADLVDDGDPGPIDVRLLVQPGQLHVDLAGTSRTRTITAAR